MAFTGNSSFSITNFTAFAVEKAVAKGWTAVYTQNHPLIIALAEKGTNFNTGFDIQGNTAITIPILGDDMTTPASGISDASELTADPLNISNGMSDASYPITHYRAHQTYRESEMTLAQGGIRANFAEGKKTQVIESFKNRWSTDVAGTAVGSRTNVMGIRYALSTSNSPGGISQTTDPQWAAQVKTSAGTFGLNVIDDQFDNINAEGRSTADLILASNTGTSNMFGKIRTAIGPTAERLVNPNGIGKYGLTTIEYLGCTVVMDSRGVSGEVILLSTPTWYVMLPKAPKSHTPYLKEGTDASVQTFTLWSSLGLSDPSCNARITGLT